MGSRYLAYWRVYVYTKDLYSISGYQMQGYRDCSPIAYRRDLSELRRVLEFANRDLTVLLLDAKTEVLNIIYMLEEMMLEINMRSEEFYGVLVNFLGPKTNQFIHELFSFARSPYNDMISYELNITYSARNGNDIETYQCFLEFSMVVDEDECVSVTSDVEVEQDELDEPDEGTDLSPSEPNAPILLGLRHLLAELAENSPDFSVRDQPSAAAPTNGGVGGGGGGGGTSARAGNAIQNSPTVMPNDAGETAIDVSTLGRSDFDHFMAPRGEMSNSNHARDMPVVAPATTSRNAAAGSTHGRPAVARNTARRGGGRHPARAAARGRRGAGNRGGGSPADGPSPVTRRPAGRSPRSRSERLPAKRPRVSSRNPDQ